MLTKSSKHAAAPPQNFLQTICAKSFCDIRHTATATGRAFCSPSLCYMTKDPLSPGFFPHRPGGYLKVPSQLTACPDNHTAFGATTRRDTPPRRPPRRRRVSRLVWSPRNACEAQTLQPPDQTRPDKAELLKSGAKQQNVVSKQQFAVWLPISAARPPPIDSSQKPK